MIFSSTWSLALNIRVLDADGNEIALSELSEDEIPSAITQLSEVDAAVDGEAEEYDDDEDASDEDGEFDDDYDDGEFSDDEDAEYESDEDSDEFGDDGE